MMWYHNKYDMINTSSFSRFTNFQGSHMISSSWTLVPYFIAMVHTNAEYCKRDYSDRLWDVWLYSLTSCHFSFWNIPWVREEPLWEVKRGEERKKRWENFWLPVAVDWSYHANRFELGSRSDPASWLEELYSVKFWLALVNWQVYCYWLLVNQFSWHLW